MNRNLVVVRLVTELQSQATSLFLSTQAKLVATDCSIQDIGTYRKGDAVYLELNSGQWCEIKMIVLFVLWICILVVFLLGWIKLVLALCLCRLLPNSFNALQNLLG